MDDLDHEKQLEEAALEKPLALNEQRYQAAIEILEQQGAARIIDLGCNNGRFIKHLLKLKTLKRIAGMDVRLTSGAAQSKKLEMFPNEPIVQYRWAPSGTTQLIIRE